jgi:adenylylsulfate kinase-like enzyme
VIIWVNGPFGVGKTTVATQLLSRLPNAMLYDPETVGAMLRTYLPDTEADFQDLPPWRPLVAATAVELIAYTGQPLITPMSLLHEDYAKKSSPQSPHTEAYLQPNRKNCKPMTAEMVVANVAMGRR